MKPKTPKKVLVLDDDVAITEAMHLALSIFGFSVKVISSSREFRPLVSKFKPDLVVLDFFLAGEEGTSLVEQLRSDKVTKNIKIIMFSAHPSAKEEIAKFKVDAFVAKPFDINFLARKINSLLA